MGASTQGDPDLLAPDLLAAWRVELEGSPYHVVRLLGRGGMGAVFEVVHRALGWRRVLKLVSEPGRFDLEDRLRFEAQTLARLAHPNLLQVHDLGTSASGRVYMVTELLQGRTLKEELRARGGALPVREAIDIALAVLDGLGAAHAAGVVHRDLKPDNIFLLGSGSVKVIDFGIAKIVAVEGSVVTRMKAIGPLAQPTRTGFLLGTPQVMSPEQLLAKPVDARSDLYALGAVLFRCLTGRLLFVEKELVDLAKAHVFQAPDAPSAIASQPVPAALDAVVLKALAKSPADRYASAAQMAAALRAVRVDDDVAATPVAVGESAVLESADETATVAFEIEHETFTSPTLPLLVLSPDEAPASASLREAGPVPSVAPPHRARASRRPLSPALWALLVAVLLLSVLLLVMLLQPRVHLS